MPRHTGAYPVISFRVKSKIEAMSRVVKWTWSRILYPPCVVVKQLEEKVSELVMMWMAFFQPFEIELQPIYFRTCYHNSYAHCQGMYCRFLFSTWKVLGNCSTEPPTVFFHHPASSSPLNCLQAPLLLRRDPSTESAVPHILMHCHYKTH